MNLYIMYYTKGNGENDASLYAAPDRDPEYAYRTMMELWGLERDEIEGSLDNLDIYPIDSVDATDGTSYAITLTKETTK